MQGAISFYLCPPRTNRSDCFQLYDDSLEDELNITSLRMLVKDLLVLFQAANEGVINVLGTHSAMHHVDTHLTLTARTLL
jgi:hypothetical protein